MSWLTILILASSITTAFLLFGMIYFGAKNNKQINDLGKNVKFDIELMGTNISIVAFDEVNEVKKFWEEEYFMFKLNQMRTYYQYFQIKSSNLPISEIPNDPFDSIESMNQKLINLNGDFNNGGIENNYYENELIEKINELKGKNNDLMNDIAEFQEKTDSNFHKYKKYKHKYKKLKYRNVELLKRLKMYDILIEDDKNSDDEEENNDDIYVNDESDEEWDHITRAIVKKTKSKMKNELNKMDKEVKKEQGKKKRNNNNQSSNSQVCSIQ
jgi:hypothetical protein